MADLAKWYEGVYEAKFKPMPSGYVFQIRSPWIFGPQRSYSVNEAQKAEIITRLRSKRRRELKALVIYVLIAALSLIAAFIVATVSQLRSGGAIGAVFIGAVIPGLLFLVVSTVLEARRLHGFLGALPCTTERISLHESRELYVRAASFRALLLQVLVCTLLTLYAASMAADGLDGHWNPRVYLNLAWAIAGVLATAWAAYLLILKWRQSVATS